MQKEKLNTVDRTHPALMRSSKAKRLRFHAFSAKPKRSTFCVVAQGKMCQPLLVQGLWHDLKIVHEQSSAILLIDFVIIFCHY